MCRSVGGWNTVKTPESIHWSCHGEVHTVDLWIWKNLQEGETQTLIFIQTLIFMG